MTDLVTPTGRLVYDGEPHTEEWFGVRRQGITGTDLPKILGLSKYGTALSVWLDKRGELDDEAGEAALWGNLLEDVVAQEWAQRNETSVEEVGVIAKHGEEWIRASLDRLVDRCPDVADPQVGEVLCGLEVKTRSAYKKGSWKEREPDDVLAQVAWGLLATGLDHMHLAVLIGGQELLAFRVDRDATLEDYLTKQARPVWEAVQAGDPPPVNPDAEGVLLQELNKLYAKRAGERDLNPAEVSPWLEQYAEAQGEAKAAKARQVEAQTALVQSLDDGDTGLVDERPAFTYRAPEPADRVTADDLRALRKDNPELYEALREEGLITTSEPGPRFNFKWRKPDA